MNVPRRSRGSATLPRQEYSHADTSQRAIPRTEDEDEVEFVEDELVATTPR